MLQYLLRWMVIVVSWVCYILLLYCCCLLIIVILLLNFCVWYGSPRMCTYVLPFRCCIFSVFYFYRIMVNKDEQYVEFSIDRRSRADIFGQDDWISWRSWRDWLSVPLRAVRPPAARCSGPGDICQQPTRRSVVADSESRRRARWSADRALSHAPRPVSNDVHSTGHWPATFGRNRRYSLRSQGRWLGLRFDFDLTSIRMQFDSRSTAVRFGAAIARGRHSEGPS